jgi:sugar (pentulose or hexulose) kinase
MAVIGIDIGTTHCKVGLYQEDGALALIRTHPTPAQQAGDGRTEYDAERLWQTVAGLLSEVYDPSARPEILAIGIASMAESGLLIDLDTGGPISPLIPWFDPSATPQAYQIARQSDPRERFLRSGLRLSFKCSLAKILWLRDEGLKLPARAVWLGAADYIAFRLTGKLATDFSLAGRTAAFCLAEKTWDADVLAEFDLSTDLFPPIRPSGSILGGLTANAGRATGLPAGIPVAIAGHDHICAAFAAGVVQPGDILDSMGTAEALVGVMDEHALGEREYQSGLSFGWHAAPGRMYWMGGLSSSGGALEWLRHILTEPALSYTEIERLASSLSPDPGDLLFFPYLSGSGSPHTDQNVRAAWVGLDASTRRADLVKAILEGTAFEAEWICREGAQVAGIELTRLIAAGGGTHLEAWMQIKADLSGCPYIVQGSGEAVLCGAAILAAIGAGAYSSPVQALAAWARPAETIFHPDTARHLRFLNRFEHRYLAFQKPLRDLFDDQPQISDQNRERV